jgi:hypothetical protein
MTPFRIWSIVAALGVAAIATACFVQSLDIYFLSKDVLPLSALHDAFAGRPEAFLESLWIGGAPLVQLLFAYDYSVWGANSVGYHITNIICHVWASLALYLVARELLSDQSNRDRVIVAFFSAALFAAYPAHADAVAWISGRSESLSAALYMTCLWLFMKSPRLSIATYILALGSGIAAITLPAVLTVYGFLYKQQNVWKRTLPFWLGAVAYTLIFALSQTNSINIGTTFDAFMKLLVPLPAQVIEPGAGMERILRSLYLLCGLILVWRATWFPFGASVLRHLGFVLVWLFLCVLPALPSLDVDRFLNGSRFFYIGSAPLCLAFVLTVVPLASSANVNTLKVRLLRGVACVAMAGLVAWSGFVAVAQHYHWIVAGNSLLRFSADAQTELAATPEGQRFALEAPVIETCVPVLPDFNMLQSLLRPPLCGRDLSMRLKESSAPVSILEQ